MKIILLSECDDFCPYFYSSEHNYYHPEPRCTNISRIIEPSNFIDNFPSWCPLKEYETSQEL